MIMKNTFFCDVMPRGSCKKRRFGGTPVLTRATWRNNPRNMAFFIITAVKTSNLATYDQFLETDVCLKIR
jgi:hypothetical protein